MICGFLKTARIWLSLSLSLLLAKMSLQVDSWPEVGSSWSKERLWGRKCEVFYFPLSFVPLPCIFSSVFFLHASLSSPLFLALQVCRIRFTYTSQFHVRATCFIINTTQFNGSHIYVHSHGASVHGRDGSGWWRNVQCAATLLNSVSYVCWIECQQGKFLLDATL